MTWTWKLGILVVAVLGWLVYQRLKRPAASESPAPAPTNVAPDEALAALLAPHVRPAFDPVVEEGDVAEPVSKFGGMPWLPEGDGWPICPSCKKPMAFFVQLDVASLPKAAGATGHGLIQLFMCVTYEKDGCVDSWNHYGKAAVARLVDTSKPGANASRSGAADPFPCRRIVGWEEAPDHPDPEEWEGLGVTLPPALEARIDDLWEQDRVPLAGSGDKLLGWPFWVQGPEYGRCSECGGPMHYLFQLDSEDNVPYMLGDVGTGHVHQCPKHPHVVAWGWACG